MLVSLPILIRAKDFFLLDIDFGKILSHITLLWGGGPSREEHNGAPPKQGHGMAEPAGIENIIYVFLPASLQPSEEFFAE